ncbi:MAG: hypothetical protein A3A58_02905 [Candidatus Blackburnbacteria bacterium RIFCSPLOWO2_01_FULL_41_27]|uniref:Undecaprenyl-phosphate alpha-N-acetylglucosaminyl 1-phosphate transferase n=2 Tax=Candidatus Blackburniibacteriota TaxID=1817898 RepID=A0A1G1V699_9BACT|nr:MAG: hypothetical protein A3F61_01980 [Candidatus Blackburnbacteria bacterium RIFCSPHIGHO2_12_FULL_41_13b]OGY12882.1 MAG: hypothetical protein A3A58_02905 [Candidatus Blackburnbacteria bacterium RIFCSPLOWO2_01_FULL_41_27]
MFEFTQLTTLFFSPAAAAFIISLLVTPLIIKLAPVLKIIDDPKIRRHPAILHTKPTPRGGGIPLFLAIAAASLIFLPQDGRLLAILLGGLVVVIIGFLDDRRDSSPYMRLVAQFLSAGIVVASGIGISFITNPFGGIIDLSGFQINFSLLGVEHSLWIFSALFGLVWIVALMNAVSWSSGVDGQLSGFAAISALVIAVFSLQYSADITQWPVTILAAITFGAFAGFLPWHAYPQKIMPGFGGATLAGYMLAVLSILTTAKVGILLVVLAIPVVDAGYSIVRRLMSGKSPVWGDKKHLHHRLLDAGFSRQKVAIFYWISTTILGILALNLNATHKFYTIIGIALFVGVLIICLNSWLRSSKPQDRVSG